MPYLYTAKNLEAKAIQNPDFMNREIVGYTTGKLEEMQLVGIAAEKQIAYDGYISNLPAFLRATADQAKVACSRIWFKLKAKAEHVIPLKMPHLMVNPRAVLKTSEEKENFRTSLGVTSETVRGPQGEAYLIRDVTPSMISSLPTSTMNPYTPSQTDSVSLSTMSTYFFTVKLISIFLSTHTYPAFQTAEGAYQHTRDTDIVFKKTGYVPVKKWRGNNDTYKGHDKVGEINEDVDFGEFKAFADEKINAFSSLDSVFVAKPAPLYPEVNYGLPTSVPNLPGYCLPYFRNICEPSKPVIVQVIRRYFLACFGDSSEEASVQWANWLKGVEKWHKSDAGRVVAHILFCIQLALESQSRVYILLSNGVYLGSCLLGFKFVIWRNGQVVLPETADALHSLAIRLDAHSGNVEKISTILSRLSLSGGMEVEETPVLSSARKTFLEINKREKPTDSDEVTELAEAVNGLTFDEKYWPIAVDKLILWISTIQDDDKEISEDWPMYLTGEMMYDTSRAHQILAAFGPMAPSMVDSGGKDFEIPKGLLAIDEASTEDPDTKTLRLASIFVTGKKLKVAVGDCVNMLKKRRIRQNTSERAAGYRTIRFTGTGRTQIWEALRKLPFDAPDKGKKRARDETWEDAEVPVGKKGKTKEVAPVPFDMSDFL